MIYGLATLHYENGDLVDYEIESILDTNVYNNGGGNDEIRNTDKEICEDLHHLIWEKIGPTIPKDVYLVHLSFSTEVSWIPSYHYEGVEYEVFIEMPTILSYRVETIIGKEPIKGVNCEIQLFNRPTK